MSAVGDVDGEGDGGSNGSNVSLECLLSAMSMVKVMVARMVRM